ncbi:MAG: hypothetical protein J6S44_02080, partial [Clostridia bacterium]|nr:hypothetical protein [Clostridia bacterium]
APLAGHRSFERSLSKRRGRDAFRFFMLVSCARFSQFFPFCGLPFSINKKVSFVKGKKVERRRKG